MKQGERESGVTEYQQICVEHKSHANVERKVKQRRMSLADISMQVLRPSNVHDLTMVSSFSKIYDRREKVFLVSGWCHKSAIYVKYDI